MHIPYTSQFIAQVIGQEIRAHYDNIASDHRELIASAKRAKAAGFPVAALTFERAASYAQGALTYLDDKRAIR